MSSSSRLLALVLVCSMLAPLPSRADASAQAAPFGVDRDWVTKLTRRVERLLPVLMASLAAARRERDPLLIRCFDRTVAALHGTGKQLQFHAQRWENEASPRERKRHAQALRVLSARVDELAHMPELCFTGGEPRAPDETYVEVVKPRH